MKNKKIKLKLGITLLMSIILLSLVLLKKYNFSIINLQIVIATLIITVIFIIIFKLLTYWNNEKLEKKKNILISIFEYFQTIVFSLLCIQILYSFIIFPSVKGPSMLPTLHENDRIIVTTGKNNVERFDIVVFIIDTKVLKDAPLSEEGQLWVKRVIGLPGDTISYNNGFLYVNGIKTNEPYLKSENYETFLPSQLNNHKIPKGYYLVLGDNRKDSMDSRSIGLIPEELIIGEGKYIINSIFKWTKIGG